MNNKLRFFSIWVATIFFFYASRGQTIGMVKVRDIVIYEDSLFYNAFPSVIKTKAGFLLAFRRAPDRRIFGSPNNYHVDHNSYLVTLKSTDGINWSSSPDLLYAHPFGGSQDPCLIALRDGTILCTSYGWTTVADNIRDRVDKPFFQGAGFVFLGGYLIRSADDGHSWQGPFYPPSIKEERHYNPFGNQVPAYNRGALYETKDGRVLWAVAAHDSKGKTSNYLLTSRDKGLSWQFASVVATDEKISFNEASVYETPKGDIVAFMRTAQFGDQACIARSTDGGKSFKWQSMEFQGHPIQALALPDKRVLLVYGYRHEPFGIRARILNEDCTDFKEAPEFVLRDDGGSTDIGYPWAVQLSKNRVLVVYYFNKAGGRRFIAGTIVDIKPRHK